MQIVERSKKKIAIYHNMRICKQGPANLFNMRLDNKIPRAPPIKKRLYIINFKDFLSQNKLNQLVIVELFSGSRIIMLN